MLALAGILIHEPYNAYFRTGGLTERNILECAPLHNDLDTHLDILIRNPKLAFSPFTADQAEFLGGCYWRTSKSMAEIHTIAPTLPHLEPLLVAYLAGVRETFKRFGDEFEKGGAAQSATADERESAWMPGTNDVNEGALGRIVRIQRRNKPTQSLHQNVAQAKFAYNGTDLFMEENFDDEDDKFIMQENRRRDESHLERDHLTELREHDERIIAAKRQKDLERQNKATELAAMVAAVEIIRD